MYFDRNATQNGAKRSGSAGMDRRANAAWVLPQAVNSLWWNPGERRARRGARLTRRVREEYRVYFDRNATQNGAKRSGSAGMDRRANAAWVLPQAVNSLWWNPGERRARRGARLTRRVREEYRVYFDRNATQNGAKRSGSAGMDRRANAAWVLPQAVKARDRVPRPAAAADSRRAADATPPTGPHTPASGSGHPRRPRKPPGRFDDAPRPGAAVQAGRSCRPIRVHSQGTRRTDSSRR